MGAPSVAFATHKISFPAAGPSRRRRRRSLRGRADSYDPHKLVQRESQPKKLSFSELDERLHAHAVTTVGFFFLFLQSSLFKMNLFFWCDSVGFTSCRPKRGA